MMNNRNQMKTLDELPGAVVLLNCVTDDGVELAICENSRGYLLYSKTPAAFAPPGDAIPEVYLHPIAELPAMLQQEINDAIDAMDEGLHLALRGAVPPDDNI